MPDALLLDWEGCLADTVSMRESALQRALQDEGLTLSDADCARCCEGASADTGVRRALSILGTRDPVLAGLVAARASRAFAERLGKGFILKRGAHEMLSNAQVTSRIAIVTQASRSETEFALRLAGLDITVSTIVSASDELQPPPSPAPFIAALAQLAKRRASRPDRSVAIASSAAMLRSARSAGLRTIALAAPAHVGLDADGAVDTLEDLTMSALSLIAGIAAAEHSR
ncbi:MAG: HAD family phosphatase [Gemmatimonadota bacterium]|nr:HAD family phosphatase [Gemmatimonadota bacterium]